MGLTPELRTYFGAPSGNGLLVAHVDASGPAARAGVRVGDVITSVNDNPVEDATDITAALAQARDQGNRIVSLRVIRDRSTDDLKAKLRKPHRAEPSNGQQL
jgi:serine protease Do